MVNIEHDIQFQKPFNVYELNVHGLMFICLSASLSFPLFACRFLVVVANDIFRMLTNLTNNGTFTDYTLNTESFHRTESVKCLRSYQKWASVSACVYNVVSATDLAVTIEFLDYRSACIRTQYV